MGPGLGNFRTGHGYGQGGNLLVLFSFFMPERRLFFRREVVPYTFPALHTTQINASTCIYIVHGSPFLFFSFLILLLYAKIPEGGKTNGKKERENPFRGDDVGSDGRWRE